MMKRHAQVGKDAVHLLHAMIAHEIGQESEVGVYKCKPRVVKPVFPGVEVLVQAIEMTLRAQMLHDGTTVAATAIGHVNVDSIGLDGKSFNHFIQ